MFKLSKILKKSISDQRLDQCYLLDASDIIVSNIKYVDSIGFIPHANEIVKINIKDDGPKAIRKHINNIELSVKNVMSLAVHGAFTTSSTLADVWLLPFALILFLQECNRQVTEVLDRNDAYVLFSVSRINLYNENISVETIYNSVRYLTEKYGVENTIRSIDISLEKLLKIGVLEINNGAYKLVEKVKVTNDE